MEDAGINYADAAKMIGWTKPNLWDKLNKRTELTFGSVVQIVCGLDADIKLTNMTINELLDIFPDNFIQCHRKYIVNLHHFYSYDKSTFIIQVGKHSIPLGRKHKKDIEERLHLI